jgi:predicted AlkP superfamily pyrophosphatase or phosphodiesterase
MPALAARRHLPQSRRTISIRTAFPVGGDATLPRATFDPSCIHRTGVMHPVIVINVVGLTSRLLGPSTPHLSSLAARSGARPLRAILPAVTCAAQSTMLTGLPPSDHGIVGNGWYFRDLGEVFLWRQSNRLVQGEKIWEVAKRRDAGFTCANLFWWYAMHTAADISVTPRPIYLADGRKLPDCYATPDGLRDELTRQLGPFPLFRFWGPATSIDSSRWITEAALYVRARFAPTLTLVYLPHLDYDLQRQGPDGPGITAALGEVDALCGRLIADAGRDGADVIVLSEYGITRVARPVHINRALRAAGLLRVRVERGREQLDPVTSEAFAVADHQIAHVYVRDPRRLAETAAVLSALPGVETVLDADGKRAHGLDHERAGELVAVAQADAWFTWYHWLDDAKAPDFARTVEIHRKPGYDPVELFVDPAFRFPRLAVASRLARRALGFRTLLDVIPLDAALVKGSHGRPTDDPLDGPLLIGADPAQLGGGDVPMAAIKDIVLHHVFDRPAG